MNIINIGCNRDLITIDLRTRQIRFCEDIKAHGEIQFIDMSRDDADAYEYLFNEDKDLMLKSLKEDLESFIGKKIKIEECVIV